MYKILIYFLNLSGVSLPTEEELILIKTLLEETQEQNKRFENAINVLNDKVETLEEKDRVLLNKQNAEYIEQNFKRTTISFIIIFLFLVGTLIINFFPKLAEEIQFMINSDLNSIADFLRSPNSPEKDKVLLIICLLLNHQHLINASIWVIKNILLKNSKVYNDLLNKKTNVDIEQDSNIDDPNF